RRRGTEHLVPLLVRRAGLRPRQHQRAEHLQLVLRERGKNSQGLRPQDACGCARAGQGALMQHKLSKLLYAADILEVNMERADASPGDDGIFTLSIDE